jgi:hypothetical protein
MTRAVHDHVHINDHVDVDVDVIGFCSFGCDWAGPCPTIPLSSLQ